MNGKSISVAAALLAGGGALYGGYQLFGGGGDAREAARGNVVADADASLADARGDVAALDGDLDAGGQDAAGRGGVPDGTGALDFDGGAVGDDVTASARARASEAEREAERLAMLGTGDVDMARAPDDALSGVDSASRFDGGRDANGQDARRVRGLRDAASDVARSDEDEEIDVDRLLADIAASSGDNGGDAAIARASSDANGARPARTGEAAGGTRYAANTRLTDKPDQGGFAANRRLTDKPDEGGYVASADTQRFDPCEKADGTAYVGPGTALNPFAATDPCLPQATAQGYQVAQLTSPVDPELPIQPIDPAAAGAVEAVGLVAVDVARPRVPPPPPTGTGSDYRG